MTFGSIASGGGATLSILAQSMLGFSGSEDAKDLDEEEEGEVDDEGPASGCATLLGIEGILYFGVPRNGVGPT